MSGIDGTSGERPSGVDRRNIQRAPTATKLTYAAGKVVICGSHGGRLPGALALKAGVRGVIFNDAGTGRNRAGVAGLELCRIHGVAAAAVAHTSCRIGDPDDMAARGVISVVNPLALQCGVFVGMRCEAAAERLATAQPPEERFTLDFAETRRVLPCGANRLVLIDSASQVRRGEDDGALVVTGSHGGLVGGDPKMAIQAEPRLAAYNDAGVGADEAGVTRLPALDARGIAGICVSHESAEIGSAVSTFEDGVISRINLTAARLGAQPGHKLRGFLERLSA